MLIGQFHGGSGLGDQLFRYVTVRTLAEEKGYKWSMRGKKNFKGDFFTSFDFGGEFPPLTVLYFDIFQVPLNGNVEPAPSVDCGVWNEKEIRDEFKNDVRSYDPEINFIEDNTIIDGSFEDSKYWGHNLDNISKWLAVEPINIPDDLCLIGFRGGEYYSDPNLGLPKEYFDVAIEKMRAINPAMRFQVHTDDSVMAKQFFPEFEVIENPKISHSKNENMGLNWRSARFAKYAIIPNSAFFILPRLLKHHDDQTAVTIAPRYWARHNTRVWARPACYYKPLTYIHASDTN